MTLLLKECLFVSVVVHFKRRELIRSETDVSAEVTVCPADGKKKLSEILILRRLKVSQPELHDLKRREIFGSCEMNHAGSRFHSSQKRGRHFVISTSYQETVSLFKFADEVSRLFF